MVWVLFLLGVHCSDALMKSVALGGDCTILPLTALFSPPHLHPSSCIISKLPRELKPSNYCFQRIRLVMSLLLVMGWFFLKGQPRSGLCNPEIMESIMLWVCTGFCVVTGPNSPMSLSPRKKTNNNKGNKSLISPCPGCFPGGWMSILMKGNTGQEYHKMSLRALCLEKSGNAKNFVHLVVIIGINWNISIQ